MKVYYNKLFDRLKDDNILQKDFMQNAKLSSGTLNRLRNNQNVEVEAICRICDFTGYEPDEVMDWVKDKDCEEYEKNYAQMREEKKMQIKEMRKEKQRQEKRMVLEKRLTNIQRKIDRLNNQS